MSPITKQAPSDAASHVTDVHRYVDIVATPRKWMTLSELHARFSKVEHDLRAPLVLTSALLATILVEGA